MVVAGRNCRFRDSKSKELFVLFCQMLHKYFFKLKLLAPFGAFDNKYVIVYAFETKTFQTVYCHFYVLKP